MAKEYRGRNQQFERGIAAVKQHRRGGAPGNGMRELSKCKQSLRKRNAGGPY